VLTGCYSLYLASPLTINPETNLHVTLASQPNTPTLVTRMTRSFPCPPSSLATDIPNACRQLLLVLSPSTDSPSAQTWLLERPWNGDPWHLNDGPFTTTLGRAGLAWGTGLHRYSPPPNFPLKTEGDKRSPAGLFPIPQAFGIAPQTHASHLRLPYIPITEHTIGVDDVTSKHYNQIVDDRQVLRDWVSHEAMIQHAKLYEWGAVIAHNPDCIPGLGSCIFLHLAPDGENATAGCTALNSQDLQATLSWLDPAKHPLLLQGLASWQ
jgi:L,D-peptidoglycan transpeptidase YkuD (ErfK/YbiS/YcfS/YnhG family)